MIGQQVRSDKKCLYEVKKKQRVHILLHIQCHEQGENVAQHPLTAAMGQL